MLRGLRPAVSAALAIALASAGVATASAESWDGTVSGELLDVIVETEGAPTEERVVVADDGEVSQVEGDAIEQIDAGSTVEVTVSGSDVEKATVLEPASETVALSTHRAYVVAIDDPSASGDVTLANAVANTEYAAGYWVREARGAIASFDVADSTTLTWDGSCAATYSQLWTTAAAEFPGVNFSGAGNHLVVYTPSSCSYSYAGVATVGSMPAGGYVHISSLGPSTTVHELGHNLGLGHSNALWGDPYGTYGFAEYYGVYGPQAGSIGSLAPGALDAAYRTYLDLPGWQSQTETLTVDPAVRETRTVTLTETTSGSGITAITLVDDSDGSQYFLDFRSGRGSDSGAFYPMSYSKLSIQGLLADYSPGVVVTWMPGGRDVEIIGVADGSDLWTSFQAGDSYTAPDRLFSVTVVSTTASTATVEVVTSPDASAGAPSTTTVSVPDSYEGTTATASITVSSDAAPTGDVEVFLDGALHATETLVDGGAAVDLPSDLSPGSHTVRAVYSGADGIAGSQATATATVLARTAPELTLFARPAWYGVPVLVTIEATGADVAGADIVVSYGGSTWNATLDESGVAEVSMPDTWDVGTRTLTVSFLGTEGSAPTSATVKAITMQLTPPVTVVAPTASGSHALLSDAELSAMTSAIVPESLDEEAAGLEGWETETSAASEGDVSGGADLRVGGSVGSAVTWGVEGRLLVDDGYTMRLMIR